PEDYWDALALPHPSGTLILAASSFGVIEKVYSRRSPLLGLVKPVRIPVINASDTIASLAPRLDPVHAVQWSVILRDPWVIPYAEDSLYRETPIGFLVKHHRELVMTVKGLVGEVFSEEERKLTRLYEETLKLLGAGYWSPAEIAHTLYTRGLIENPSPGTATGILGKLETMGLVSKLKLWKTRRGRYYYKHTSPLLSITYGLMEKYGTDELDIPLKEEWVTELYSRELAFTLGEVLAEYHDGIQAYTILPHGKGDIDIVILDKKAQHPIACYEAKTGKCKPGDTQKHRSWAISIGCPEAKTICTNEDNPGAIGYKTINNKTIIEYSVRNIRRLTVKYS
ncbi:MAG: hypothetical protein GSR83_00115, partial [Desulfurococcales archaeon]|nr:hypothetical protein [Desulfurococcales archaeon]